MVKVEIWKGIKGMGGVYEVSNTGKIRSLPSIISKRNGKKYKCDGAEKKFLISPSGYHITSLAPVKKILFVHRVVATAFLENPNGYPQVNHIDGVKTNNNVSNLEWCSAKQNMRHAFETGLIKPKVGEERPSSKLTNNDIIKIRTMRGNGEKYKTIASEFNICIAVAFNIVNRKIWKHVI